MNTGTQLRGALSTITADNIPATLWELLPDHVAGEQWRGEIIASAYTLKDWIDESEEYDLDRLQDMTFQLADSEVEDYYNNINRRVQELSLWASSDLDEEVQELLRPNPTLTDLNSAYLYCAMRGLYYALSQWAIDTTEEGAEDEAI